MKVHSCFILQRSQRRHPRKAHRTYHPTKSNSFHLQKKKPFYLTWRTIQTQDRIESVFVHCFLCSHQSLSSVSLPSLFCIYSRQVQTFTHPRLPRDSHVNLSKKIVFRLLPASTVHNATSSVATAERVAFLRVALNRAATALLRILLIDRQHRCCQ